MKTLFATAMAALFLAGCASSGHAPLGPGQNQDVQGHATVKYFPQTGEPTYHRPD